ncbi:DUF4157 domain-containing protein [Streptomyces sp. KHY 26]|uniref:eCIS core domain-containing protein n=1 Tax=Streptomyces sp. KHY 26 TaxID=3097359 RepID=UPI00376EFD2F
MHGHRKRHENPTAAGTSRSAPARAADPRRPGQEAAPRPDALASLQRLVGNAAVAEMLGRAEQSEAAQRRSASVRGVLRSPGRPLDDAVRGDMESRLGADFSDVRVHTDHAAHESAASVAAEAYTSGSHIVFGRGRYDPASDAGRTVLAHELTHVVQQRRGPVAGTDTGGGLAVSDPSDRFEREAERVARRVTGGGTAGGTAGAAADATAPAASPGPGLPVARLMSVEEFRRSTAVGRFQKRGSSVDQVEKALADCHKEKLDDFGARARQLTELVRIAGGYGDQSKSGRHQDVVRQLLAEGEAEAAIYRQLADAGQERDALAKARGFLAAQEAVLRRIHTAGLDSASDMALVNVYLQTSLNQAVNQLTAAQKSTLVEDDLHLLAGIQADTEAPQATRDVLGDLLAHRDIVHFTTGMPGTSLSPAGTPEKYTLKHMMSQPAGATERLGSLAHELTHVDAGESYDNTPVLLLLRQDLGDAEIRELARERSARVRSLEGLLERSATLDAEQRALFAAKLRYATDPAKGVGRYAAMFRTSGKIDEDTHRRLQEIENLSKPHSSVLVEYDTVVTQLLVYLHRWGIAQEDPLHAAVARLADELRTERRSAAAGS